MRFCGARRERKDLFDGQKRIFFQRNYREKSRVGSLRIKDSLYLACSRIQSYYRNAYKNKKQVKWHLFSRLQTFLFQLSPLAQDPISVAQGFSHDTALFDVTCPQPVYPRHYSFAHSSTHHRSAPSSNFPPGRSLGSGPYPGGSGMFTVTHPSEVQESCSPHGTLRRSLRGLQPQTTIPSASNVRGFGVSTITHPPRIQETPSPPLHGLRHQSTIRDVPNRGGYGLSTDTLQPQIPELRASYGTSPSPSLHELQPHHTFPDASYLSGCGLSTVTHPPGISGRSSSFGTIRLPQYEQQPQSVIPGDPHLSDPATSSVTHPSVIRFPSDGTLRPPLYGTHAQNVIPGVPYLSGPEEGVETRNVSKKKLPTSSRPLPDKKDYRGRIFRHVTKTGTGK